MGDTFAQRLAEARKEKGYTQPELANLLGLSTSSISMYEKGHREPCSETLQKLCKILGVGSDYLLGVDKNVEINNVEINDAVKEFTDMLTRQEGLMFNGKPLLEKDREKLANAIRIAVAVTADTCEGGN